MVGDHMGILGAVLFACVFAICVFFRGSGHVTNAAYLLKSFVQIPTTYIPQKAKGISVGGSCGVGRQEAHLNVGRQLT